MITQSALIDKFIMGGTSGRASNMEIKGDELVTTGYGSDVIIAKRMPPIKRYVKTGNGYEYRTFKRFILNHELSIDYWLAKDHIKDVARHMNNANNLFYAKAPGCDLSLINEFTIHQIRVHTHKMMKAVSNSMTYARVVTSVNDNWGACWSWFGNDMRDWGQLHLGRRIAREQKSVIREYTKSNNDLVKAKRQAFTYKRQAKKAENRIKELEDELGMRKKDKKMYSVVNTVRRLKAG